MKLDGIDDGPRLPKSVIDAWRDPCILRRWKCGASLRKIADEYSMSHEGVRGRLRRMGYTRTKFNKESGK